MIFEGILGFGFKLLCLMQNLDTQVISQILNIVFKEENIKQLSHTEYTKNTLNEML